MLESDYFLRCTYRRACPFAPECRNRCGRSGGVSDQREVEPSSAVRCHELNSTGAGCAFRLTSGTAFYRHLPNSPTLTAHDKRSVRTIKQTTFLRVDTPIRKNRHIDLHPIPMTRFRRC